MNGQETTEDGLEELKLEQDDFDAEEPMMPGSDDKFSDLEDGHLEDTEDDDGDSDICHSIPTPSSQ